MNLDPCKVSVVIPAYNQPGYLRQALQSVKEQLYRPIEVIVADDCSPLSLQPVVDEFAGAENNAFTIHYLRQSQNRGVMDNFRSAVAQATGKYLVPLPHDNRFIDKKFFAESLQIMGNQADCHLCYGNAVFEDSNRPALNIPESIRFHDGWALLSGKDFIRLYRRGGMDFSQAMVLDHEMALSLKAFDEPFVVNGAVSRKLGIAQDDIFSYVFLLSAMGSIALCEKRVCEIGVPPESYSRSNQTWRDTKGKVKFVIFYNIFRTNLKGQYASDVKRMAFKQALQYADRILDPRIARYYGWSRGIMLMMGLSVVKRGWSEIRYGFKRFINRIRPDTFKKTKRR